MKKISAFLLTAIMCIAMSVPAFASEAVDAVTPEIIIAENGNDIMPQAAQAYSIGQNNQFVTVYTKTSDGDRNIMISVDSFNPSSYQMDIIMWGSEGIIWREDDCLHNSSSRTFGVGSNVTSISVRIIPRNKLFPASPKSFMVEIRY